MGGSAEVWRARDERTHRPVAVKRLHSHLAAEEGARLRLIGEARAVAELSHPGIVRVLDIDPGDRPAVVLELVDGESLAQRLRRTGPLPPREAAAVGLGIAEALYHAHTRGIIHRDVKPANVLLAADGRAVLIDFGIARILGDAADPGTETGMVMGTLRYMAPEQLAGDPLTPRVDLYGLGAVLFEMLSGAPPYPASAPAELLEAQSAGAPELDGTDAALAHLARACLAGSPNDRPLHAGLVASALAAWLEGDPSPAMALHADPAPARHRPSAAVRELPPTTLLPPAPRRTSARRAGPLRGRLVFPPMPRVPRGIGSKLVVVCLTLLVMFAAGAGFAAVTKLGSTRETASGAGPTAPPVIVPALPAWAASLASDYRTACGAGAPVARATANDLAEMGQAAAQRYVEALSAGCAAEQAPTPAPTPVTTVSGGSSPAGSAGGRGQANGHGNGNGRGNGHSHEG